MEVYSQVRHSAEVRRCSFCGKREDQVFKLIEGPGVAICDECVDVVHDVVVKARANLDTR